MLQILVAVFIAVLIAYTIFQNYRPGVLPGPFHLPFIGAGFQLVWLNLKYPTYQLVTKLAVKYGPAYRLQVATNASVVLTDPDLMRDVMASEDWESRPVNSFLTTLSFGKNLGILFGNGETWRETRRFTTKSLKNLGFGRTNVMEDIISTELDVVIADIDARNKQTDKPVEVQVTGLFDACTFNSIWFMLVGKKLERDDVKMKQICEIIQELMLGVPLLSNIYLLFPFLRHVLPGGKKLQRIYHKFYKIMADMIADVRKDGSYLNEQSTFFDLYLKEVDRRKEVGLPPGCFFDEEFTMTAMALVVGGYETTARVTEAGILALILFPRVQEKIQAEIDAVVGSGRRPDFADMRNMPYTHATVLEALRVAPVLPLNVRFAHKETRFGKYTIPGNTIGLFNIYGCHMDPKNWDNPTEFRPERFLDEHMNIVNSHKILPFGHGKRLCPGEALARAEIFTFIAVLMQRYTILESTEKPAGGVWLQYKNGFSISLPPFYARFVPRDSSHSGSPSNI